MLEQVIRKTMMKMDSCLTKAVRVYKGKFTKIVEIRMISSLKSLLTS